MSKTEQLQHLVDGLRKPDHCQHTVLKGQAMGQPKPPPVAAFCWLGCHIAAE